MKQVTNEASICAMKNGQMHLPFSELHACVSVQGLVAVCVEHGN
jgi:hypothetical protein